MKNTRLVKLELLELPASRDRESAIVCNWHRICQLAACKCRLIAMAGGESWVVASGDANGIQRFYSLLSDGKGISILHK
jgi:hypothetical protein